MKYMASISRTFLSSESRHVYNLSRGLGRSSTTILVRSSIPSGSRRYGTVRQGYVPWLRKRAGSVRIAGTSKRWLSDAPSQDGTNEHSDSIVSMSSPYVRLPDDNTIEITRPDRGTPIVLDRHWLRDACDCSICVDPDSGQKNFGTCDVPTELPIQNISDTEDGGIEVVWDRDFLTPDKHVSRYSADTIYRRLDPAVPVTIWDKATFEQSHLTIDYSEWMAGEGGFISGLHRLCTHGLVFLRNVPPSEESVISIANQIGDLQETFYGRTWDVRSKPNAENIAYTSSFLGLHQDLMYLQQAPRIQILHCLENTCEGGDSIFSDGRRAREILKQVRQGWKTAFGFLTKRPIKYEYNKNGHHYEAKRTIITFGSSSVSWSPPFQASQQSIRRNQNSSVFHRRWLMAATKFKELLEGEQWVYQYKMQPGDCVLFDNLRVLHGRKQFDAASGSRWLKGAYISDDVYQSKILRLSSQLMELVEPGTDQAVLIAEKAKHFIAKYGIQDITTRTKTLPEEDSAKSGAIDGE